ncbi:hypothetical protein MNY28_00305 [Sulfurimonas sp. NWX367]
MYKLQNSKYIKMCDVSDGVVVFKIDGCNKELPFDFTDIWKQSALKYRFREMCSFSEPIL